MCIKISTDDLLNWSTSGKLVVPTHDQLLSILDELIGYRLRDENNNLGHLTFELDNITFHDRAVLAAMGVIAVQARDDNPVPMDDDFAVLVFNLAEKICAERERRKAGGK